MSNLKHLFIVIPAFMLLSACGGADGCEPDNGRPLADPNANQGSCGNVGGAYNIAISYSRTNVISQITESPGYYNFKGTVSVTDQNGNTPPDGTIVQLDIVDTIYAAGVIGGADSLTGSTLAVGTPTLASGAATTFDTAGVIRNNGAYRQIETSDVVILSNANRNDQYRKVATAPAATAITVTAPYNTTYPNATYAGANATKYFVAQSVLGTLIEGVDHDNADAPLSGYTKTVNGRGDFNIIYPANVGTIEMGCSEDTVGGYQNGTGRETMDYRFDTLNSADIAVIAQLDGAQAVTTVNWEFCFNSIAPTAMSSGVSTLTLGAGNTYNTSIGITDAEGINIPYAMVEGSTSKDTVAIIVDQDPGTLGTQACIIDPINNQYRTKPPNGSAILNQDGGCTVQIRAVGSGSASVTLSGYGASASIAVTVP